MYLQRVFYSFIVAIPLMLMPGYTQAQDANRPEVLKTLEAQGVSIMDEFDAGDVRGFVGVVGDQPIAVYVTSDGSAIVGTRLSASGEPIDDAALHELAAKPISDQVWKQLEAATWVIDGQADAPRIVYTFTDANCPYCHSFWEAARPWVDAGQVQLRHLLVGVISQDSPHKAAAILDAPDSSAALLENEMKFDDGGITPAKTLSDEVAKTLEDNQHLMMTLGFRGTPGIIAPDENGLIQKFNGMPQDDALIAVLGPRP